MPQRAGPWSQGYAKLQVCSKTYWELCLASPAFSRSDIASHLPRTCDSHLVSHRHMHKWRLSLCILRCLFSSFKSPRKTEIQTRASWCAFSSQDALSLVRPHSITHSSLICQVEGTDGPGLAGPSCPSISPSAMIPLGFWAITKFPFVWIFHSISTVKPQQLSRPTQIKKFLHSLFAHPTNMY